jgi:hypothetical protein
MTFGDIYLGLFSVFMLIGFFSPDKLISSIAYPTGFTAMVFSFANMDVKV